MRPRPFPPTSPALPSPAELVALGTVLCAHSCRFGGELGGWTRAESVERVCGIDSDGWHECLQFRDRDRICCWRLYLLPDSDFLAWERLSARLPAVAAQGAAAESVGRRLWRRLSHRVAGDHWRCSVLRLHALRDRPPGLAASPAPLSRLGAGVLRRIARLEGLERVDAIQAHAIEAQSIEAQSIEAQSIEACTIEAPAEPTP